MKHYSKTLLPVVKREAIQTLTTVVNETLDVFPRTERRFTPADLWNIQKRRRVFNFRKFL